MRFCTKITFTRKSPHSTSTSFHISSRATHPRRDSTSPARLWAVAHIHLSLSTPANRSFKPLRAQIEEPPFMKGVLLNSMRPLSSSLLSATSPTGLLLLCCPLSLLHRPHLHLSSFAPPRKAPQRPHGRAACSSFLPTSFLLLAPYLSRSSLPSSASICREYVSWNVRLCVALACKSLTPLCCSSRSLCSFSCSLTIFARPLSIDF